MKLEEAIETKTKEAYDECQKASGLKLGDKVRVTRSAESHKLGWNNSWVDEMDASVGQIRTIKSISSNSGVRLSDGCMLYPYFVLEKVKPQKAEFLTCGIWMETRCSPEHIAKFTDLDADKDYIYSRDGDLLYRTKKET